MNRSAVSASVAPVAKSHAANTPSIINADAAPAVASAVISPAFLQNFFTAPSSLNIFLPTLARKSATFPDAFLQAFSPNCSVTHFSVKNLVTAVPAPSNILFTDSFIVVIRASPPFSRAFSVASSVTFLALDSVTSLATVFEVFLVNDSNHPLIPDDEAFSAASLVTFLAPDSVTSLAAFFEVFLVNNSNHPLIPDDEAFSAASLVTFLAPDSVTSLAAFTEPLSMNCIIFFATLLSEFFNIASAASLSINLVIPY